MTTTSTDRTWYLTAWDVLSRRTGQTVETVMAEDSDDAIAVWLVPVLGDIRCPDSVDAAMNLAGRLAAGHFAQPAAPAAEPAT